jgi:plastocyanin
MKYLWGLLPLLCTCALAQAAAVNVRVTDGAGQGLGDAVVVLEPVGGKLPLAPLSGVQISQAKREFHPSVTVVTVGTAVAFPNFDTVRHQVYSFSPTKQFELKLYAGVPSAPVVFDKPGVAVLGCNIHDSMVAWVLVVDTPLFGVTSAGGRAALAAVPPGAYQLRVWHAGLGLGAELPGMALKVGATDLEQEMRVNTAVSRP